MRIKKYGKKNGSKPRKNGGNSRSAAIRRGLDGDIPEIPMEMPAPMMAGPDAEIPIEPEIEPMPEPEISEAAPVVVDEMQSLANSWQPETPEGRQYKIDLEALINQFGGPSMGGQI